MPRETADAPIGIFDSGFGGLTVARSVIDQLPHESVVYLGDTARAPYGEKSLAEVVTLDDGALDEGPDADEADGDERCERDRAGAVADAAANTGCMTLRMSFAIDL